MAWSIPHGGWTAILRQCGVEGLHMRRLSTFPANHAQLDLFVSTGSNIAARDAHDTTLERVQIDRLDGHFEIDLAKVPDHLGSLQQRAAKWLLHGLRVWP